MTLNQSKGLQKLGVSESDVRIAERLLNQIPPCPTETENKVEQLLGYARTRLLREKAIRVLGTSEFEVELENAKNLGSLGAGGRRRSWAIPSDSDIALQQLKKSEFCPYPPLVLRKRRRRRHTVASPIQTRTFGRPIHSQFNV